MKHPVNRRKLRASIGLHTLLTVLSILWMLPVLWLLISSFRKEPGAYTPYLWPKAFTLDNYTRLFTDTRLFNFPRWFMNTLFVAICSCLITTILTLMVAYVYSRLRFKSRKAMMNISLILGMFPGFMSMIAAGRSRYPGRSQQAHDFLENHPAQLQAHRGEHRHQCFHCALGGFYLRVSDHEG